MSTAPLDQSLREKTLEAWVRLDNLEQRGGGVMTVQSRNGAMFDSIVFGEKQPRQWMAGSNGFARTESFDAPEESDATKRFVHVAIAYHDDGMVVGYRDGKPYGKPYKSNGPFEFKAGDTIISFGVRHLPAGGNRMLAARISKARLYDRALSAAEIYASATSTPYIDDQKVFAEVGEVNRQRVAMHEHKIVAATRQLKMLGPPPVQASERARWTELARAIFTFKEFIYIR